jgi:hypothetical protein
MWFHGQHTQKKLNCPFCQCNPFDENHFMHVAKDEWYFKTWKLHMNYELIGFRISS